VVGIIAGEVYPAASSLYSYLPDQEGVMTEPTFHPLTDEELPQLLTMMQEFYSQQHMTFDEEVAASAARETLAANPPGHIYLIYSGKILAGYFAVTFCFSLEFHGKFGLLDELYIRERCRGQGLGRRAEALATSLCKEQGFSALRLEVGKDNTAAESLYSRLGFNVEARKLMTKWL
jgi:ribosomal protein S18 acetylase RimI-like enzyme